MILLFLDTETSGILPTENQVIEIGAVLVDFDPLTLKMEEKQSFQSLVSLRQNLDEKITRITGITAGDLVGAPSLHKVQENWADWLESFGSPVDCIIGHSIDFDLGFLRHENWFLPEAKIIDTLEFSRLVLPDMQAINLEFLIKKLELNFTSTQSHHRSLYDSQACQKLFEKLVTRLNEYRLPGFLLQNLKKITLDIGLTFYGSDSSQYSQGTRISDKILEINLDGQPKRKSLQEKISILEDPEILKILEKWLSREPLSPEIRKFLVQLGVVSFLKLKNPEKIYKIHTQKGLSDYWFLEVILDHFEKLAKLDLDYKQVILERFESLLWRIKSLSESELEFGRLMELSNYLLKLLGDSRDEQLLASNLQKVVSQHEFLLFSLQPFLANRSYKFDPRRLMAEEEVISNKLKDVFQNFQSLLQSLQKVQNHPDLVGIFSQKIIGILDGFKYNFDSPLYINLSTDYLIFSQAKRDFNLKKHFNTLSQKYPKLELKSYLLEEELADFQNLFDLADLPVTASQKAPELIFVDRVNLAEFVTEKMDFALENKTRVVMLGGLNSTLKDLKNILTSEYQPVNYLLLGESGSVTKIGSKLNPGFFGLVALKLNNLESILHNPNLPEIREFWLINQPFFVPHYFWKNYFAANSPLNKSEIESRLKYWYLKSQQAYFHQKYDLKLGFIRGY